ncbi:MAG TPA: hypothetical protein VF691_07270 [Cytophagaceae bacterium]
MIKWFLFALLRHIDRNPFPIDRKHQKNCYIEYILKIMVTIIKKGTPKQEAKKLIDEAVAKAGRKDLRKYAGVLKTDIDPLEYQKKIRNEWE